MLYRVNTTEKKPLPKEKFYKLYTDVEPPKKEISKDKIAQLQEQAKANAARVANLIKKK